MPLRVGFDLDGTVADMYAALHREAVKLFGEEGLRKAGPKTSKPTPAADAAVRTLENQAQEKTSKPEDDATTNLAMQELHLSSGWSSPCSNLSQVSAIINLLLIRPE